MKVIFIVRIIGLMCEIKSMNGITQEFNTEEAIANIAKLCNLELEEIPHHETINDVFEKIKVEELEEIRKYLIVKMIRSKMLERYRIRGKKETEFMCMTDLPITDKNIENTIEVGRARWKIEKEGFNIQKN